MFKLTVFSFAVAAVLGATMAIRYFAQKGISLPLALVHGFFAAAGLVMLIAAGMQASFPGHTMLALGLFLATAAGGFLLFARHLLKLPALPALIIIHGSAAVVSFLVLLVSVFSL